jgi:hypothetical protein
MSTNPAAIRYHFSNCLTVAIGAAAFLAQTGSACGRQKVPEPIRGGAVHRTTAIARWHASEADIKSCLYRQTQLAFHRDIHA